MNNPNFRFTREIFFKVLIAILFGLGLFDLLYSFTGAYAIYGLLYPAAHVLLHIILFLSLSFIWSKEKWALYLFGAIVILHLLLDLYAGAFQVLKLLLFVPLMLFIFLWESKKE
jgi:hypothetical protein